MSTSLRSPQQDFMTCQSTVIQRPHSGIPLCVSLTVISNEKSCEHGNRMGGGEGGSVYGVDL